MKRFLSLFSIFLITMTTLSFQVHAVSTNYSMEDLVIYFGDNQEIPAWKDIITEYREDWSPPQNEDEKQAYYIKKDLAETMVLGFEKSSSYNRFKKLLVENCSYDSDLQELLPKGYEEINTTYNRDDDDDNDGEYTDKELSDFESNYESAQHMFDSALAKAQVSVVVETKIGAGEQNSFTRLLDRMSSKINYNLNWVTRTVVAVGFSIACLQAVFELLYVSTELTRPALGKEYNIHFKTRRRSQPGYNMMQPDDQYIDHTISFRLVGIAAIRAVESEFQISDDLGSAISNNIFFSFIKGKAAYLIVLSLATAAAGVQVWIGIAKSILSLLSLV